MKGNPSFSSTRGFSSYNRGRSHQYRPNFRGRGFQSSNGGSRGSFRGRNGGQFSGGYSDRFSGSSGGRFSGDRFSSRNGSSGDRFSSGSVVCQICGKFNHTALNCWYRMDESYGASSSESGPKAYVASLSCSSGPNQWYVDSAATHHITNDLNSLQLYQPYHGQDQVTVGNGSNLPILHFGQDHEASSA